MMRGICRRVVKALRQKELIPVMKTVASGTALDGKCVLVTGASGGIGIAVCESLFDEKIRYEKGGGIFSEENAAGRLVMPDEMANVVSLLAGDAGCMISGEVIHISAGRGVFDIR